MELQLAKELIIELITKNSKHIDYDYTVDMADKYKKIITGKNIESLLMQFVQREEKELFDQRVRLTKSITPSVANIIKNPFYKVTRNKKVVKLIDIKNKTKKADVEKMISTFYGDPKKKNSGLDGFMRSRFVDYTFTDPNTWLVVEWDAVDKTKLPQPRPFIVSSLEAVNFSVVNEIVEWLLVKNDIIYKVKDGGKVKDAQGLKYTLYEKDYTLVMEQVDKTYVPLENEEVVKIDKKYFLYKYFEPKVGFPPAFRLGYERDLQTNGRTFQNPFEVAMPYFEKMIERVSELDLTMKLHTFPQKLQYVNKCPGESKEKKCMGGKLVDGKECTSCKGSGYKVHTSAQDIILLPMPSDKNEMLDLSKLIEYKTPPNDIINIQRDYLKDLEAKAIQSVYNSDVFVQTRIEKTATEKNYDMESVYDTLTPFANKFSEIWKDVVSVMVALAKINLEETEIVHSFPTDLKLKTTAMLLAELQAVNDSEAPSFLRDTINEDIAEILYSDSDLSMKKHKVKRSFYPFNGKSMDEINLAISSEFVPKFDKVLYFNFEKIFVELEKDDSTFWLMPYKEQWEIVGEKVNVIIEELAESTAQSFSVNDLTGANATKQNAKQNSKEKGAGTNAGN